MFGIDDATAVAAMPTPEAAGTPGYFTEGNPGLGQAATYVRASFLNGLQLELLNILAAASITPSKTTYTQLLGAMLKIGGRASRVRGLTGATTRARLSRNTTCPQRPLISERLRQVSAPA